MICNTCNDLAWGWQPIVFT